MRRRVTILLASSALVLAACGSTDTAPSADPAATPATDAPATDTAPATGDASTPEPTAEPTTQSTADVADGVASTTAPGSPTATEPPATTAGTTADTVPPADVRAADGCSADNSPTETDVADGPAPTIEVRAASAGTALPDLAVRRVNCAGGWVNLRNELPGELPLLVWFWAPH